MKFAIAHDATRTVPLSQVVQHLGLTWEEGVSLLRLIQEEWEKEAKYAAAIRRNLGGAKVPSADLLRGLAPITEGTTAGEVGRGRAFLKSKDLDGVAASLGYWEGTAADFHNIPIDGGCQEFVAVLGQERAEAEAEAEALRRRVLNTSGRELQLLLNPPPLTVNPRRLARGVPPVRAERVGAVQVPPSGGLHPVNYVVAGSTGRAYSALDVSDWPDWEALRDAGGITGPAVAVFTAHSVVPEDLSFLDEEELAALLAQQPAGMLGSAPVPHDVFEDMGEHLPPPNEELWGPVWSNTARATL